MSPKAAKAPAPKPAIVRAPSVLVLEEKHGRRHFNVADDEALFRASLKILTERFEQGYWYGTREDIEKPEAPDFTKEQVAAMPESLMREALRKLRKYDTDKQQYDAEVEDYDNIVTAVKTKDGRLAYQALRSRQDAEYEGFSIERMESA